MRVCWGERIGMGVDANDANECPTQLIMAERSRQQKKKKFCLPQNQAVTFFFVGQKVNPPNPLSRRFRWHIDNTMSTSGMELLTDYSDFIAGWFPCNEERKIGHRGRPVA
jgi:hypothetical protein